MTPVDSEAPDASHPYTMKATKVDERAIPAAGHRSSSVPSHRPEGSAKFGKKIDAPNSLSLSPLRLAYSVPLLPADCPEVDAAVDTEDIHDSLEYKSPGAVGRGLSNWHNRNILMEELGLHDENELVNWLRKSWVIDVYGEYAEAFLNPTRLEEKAVQAKGPRIFRKYFSRGNNYSSTAEYVIKSSISALKGSGSSPSKIQKPKTIGETHNTTFGSSYSWSQAAVLLGIGQWISMHKLSASKRTEWLRGCDIFTGRTLPQAKLVSCIWNTVTDGCNCCETRTSIGLANLRRGRRWMQSLRPHLLGFPETPMSRVTFDYRPLNGESQTETELKSVIGHRWIQPLGPHHLGFLETLPSRTSLEHHRLNGESRKETE
jgi:hypothetical protein